MKIALLHLSDIHFEDKTDWIFNKAELIARATVSSVFSDPVETLIVVVSGDIANKGFEFQYNLATDFFSTITNYLKKELNVPIYLIFVPGNHDCNFGDENKTKSRKILINAVLTDSNICSRGDDIYEQCLEIQQPFFCFAEKLQEDLVYPEKPEVFYRLTIPVNDKILVFNCFNTAWLTQKREEIGHLVMPSQFLTEAETLVNGNLLSISVYHHPENWLSPENSNQFRQFLRKTSDVIITGHEHERDIFTQQQIQTGENIQVHRAAALQERSDPRSSSFNVILLDFEENKQKLLDYKWNDDKYTVKNDMDWIDFVRNRQLVRGRLELNTKFEKKLRSLNTLPITHSRRQNLQIDDLFIAPRLQVYSFENIIDGKPSKETVEKANFINFMLQKQKILLYGETLQGKTTVARYFFLKFYERGITPLFVKGELFTKAKERSVKGIIKDSFLEQYDSESWSEFEQLEKSKRMIIVDDFGQSALNQTQLQSLLAQLSSSFDYVIAVGHSNLRLQQYLENEEGEIKFSQFTHCEMRPMNRTQRAELIRKWISLANDSVSSESLAIQINQKQQIIETAYEIGTIPPYPSFLLGILQLSESAMITTVDKTKYGTIGFLYDSLITSRFQVLEDENVDLAQIYLLLGQMAYNCYKRDELNIAVEETEKILSQYQSVYQQNIYAPKFIEQIVTSGIVTHQKSKLYFSNIQLRDFFVASYFSQALGDEDQSVVSRTHDEIAHIIKTLTYESHTRILLFLVSKAYDKPRFIRQVLSISKIIFAEFTPADLSSDVEFLNHLKKEGKQKSKPELLKSGSLLERQEKLNNQIDEESETKLITEYSDKNKFLVEYKEDLDEFIKAAITLKMIEVLGQLVRSFTSTLTGNIKEDIVSECVELGLRFLKGMYQVREENIQELKEIVMQLIRERHSDLRNQELIGRADNLVLFSFFGLTYGIIKKISASLGQEDLKPIYARVFNSKQTSLSYRMVEAALRLDHYQDPVLEKIIKLGQDTENDNEFVWDVLQRLVATHLNYNSSLQAPERQKLIDKFKLGHDPAYLLNDEKEERKYLPQVRQKFLPPAEK